MLREVHNKIDTLQAKMELMEQTTHIQRSVLTVTPLETKGINLSQKSDV